MPSSTTAPSPQPAAETSPAHAVSRAAKASRRSSSQVPLREWLVAIAGGSTLAFTAWGLGGVTVSTLHTLFIGGLLTLCLAFLPWPQRTQAGSASSGAYAVRRAFRPIVANVGRLLRWPFFWGTGLFLIYLLIGACNPAAEVVRDERGWWVRAIPSVLGTSFPTSVRSDYDPMNAWRVLVSFTGTCALVWGLWAGLTRRKPTLLVLWCLLLSGAGMGLVAILQDLSEAKTVLWTYPSSNAHFWGSFFYRNQAGAYLNLILVAAAFLFFYHAYKTRQHLRSGGPHFLCFFLYFATATSIGLALSRGGILFGLILSVVFVVLLVIYGIQSLFHLRSLTLALVTVLCLGASGYTVTRYIDLDAIQDRFGDIEATVENADQDARTLSTRATWDMAQARLELGWGPGSFRYIFPMYQREYPRLFYGRFDKRKQEWVGRKMYRYAHNDIVQFVAEYGLIGSGLIFGSIALLVLQALYHSKGQVFAVLMLVTGVSQAFAHAFVDFIFNSPAYWMALLALLVAATKLLALEHKRKRAS